MKITSLLLKIPMEEAWSEEEFWKITSERVKESKNYN